MAGQGLSGDDQAFLREAIELGRSGMESGSGGPFGAVVVTDGRVLGRGSNRVLADFDPSAHAEIVAIREACRQRGHPWIEQATLYASCEPCPMCLAAIHWARIDRVVYAADRDDAAALGFDDAAFYAELARPADERRIQMRQSLREEARGMMQAWLSKGSESRY